jgi:hypothetical protein
MTDTFWWMASPATNQEHHSKMVVGKRRLPLHKSLMLLARFSRPMKLCGQTAIPNLNRYALCVFTVKLAWIAVQPSNSRRLQYSFQVDGGRNTDE